MIKLKDRIVITSVLMGSLFGLSACNRPAMMQGMGGVPVNSILLSSMPVEQSGSYQAKLISRYSVSLQPQVAGQIAKIYVTAGDHVKAGQPLMLIDRRKQEAALNSTRADALASRAAVSQAKDMLQSYQVQRRALESNLMLNKNLYERYKALYAKHSVSQQDFEKYTDSYNKAKADLDANTAQIQAQKSSILTAQSNYERSTFAIKEQEVQLQYYKIVAPYSGIVGDIPTKVGSYVTASTQLLSITQNDLLEVNVGLPVEKVFDIHQGLPVEVLDNNDKVIGSSKISFVSPTVNTDTQTILVKSILRNPTGLLKADQSVKVRVVYSKAPGILVPTSAISHLGGQDFAFLIVKNGKQTSVKQQPVKLGDLQDNQYIVVSGLKPNDEIVSDGIQKLGDGAPVTIMPKVNVPAAIMPKGTN